MTNAVKFLYKLMPETLNASYEVYRGAVVCARSPEEARLTHPDGKSIWDEAIQQWKRLGWDQQYRETERSWTAPKNVKVLEIGEAHAWLKVGPVVTSFHNA